MTSHNSGGRLAVAALVSDSEWTRLARLPETYDLRRASSPHHLREMFLRNRAVGAFISARALALVKDRTMVAGLAEQFPGHRLVGLVDAADPQAQQTLDAFAFGKVGVYKVVVVNGDLTPVRRAFDDAVDLFLAGAVLGVTRGVDITPGFKRVLTEVFRPDCLTARRLALRLGLHSATMASRFFREGLPSPKTYVAWARLVYAAHLGRQPGYTIEAIAARLGASSPQSYGRTVRIYTGFTASDFRERCDGDGMVTLFRQKLVEPFAAQLREFEPLREAVLRSVPRVAA